MMKTRFILMLVLILGGSWIIPELNAKESFAGVSEQYEITKSPRKKTKGKRKKYKNKTTIKVRRSGRRPNGAFK